MNDFAVKTFHLGKRFGSHWAVRDLELEVPRGSVFGLLGPNGSGKTTTINMLMGLLPPTKGKSIVLGMDSMKKDLKIRQRVGYVPEQYGFYEWMSVHQLVNLVAPYHKTWNEMLCLKMQNEFRLEPGAIVKNLSKGMRAKLALLLALSFEPEMLVLDEPTGGLDPAARRNFIETVLSQYQEEGKTILVSSHLLNEFAGLLDYVGFMKDGEIELVAKVEDLRSSMKRVRLIFEEQVPSELNVSNALSVRRNGREAIVVVSNFEPENTPNQLKEQSGAENIVIEEMSLEDIFVEMVES